MQTSSNTLSIVDGTEITTRSGSSYQSQVGTIANQAQNCIQGGAVSGVLAGYCYPYYPYTAAPSYHIQMRFVENGVVVVYNGKEYIFKDIIAAANHITKLRG